LNPFPETTDLSQSKDAAILVEKFTENQKPFVWQLPEGYKARYIRIQLEKKNFLHLTEIEVFSKKVKNEETFSPPRISVKEGVSPIVSYQPSFQEMLKIASKSLGITSPRRIFDSSGNEIKKGQYNRYSPNDYEVLWISEGEDFIGEVKVCIVHLCTEGAGYNTHFDYLNELKASLSILSRNFFQFYYYPVVIFHSWHAEHTKEVIKDLLNEFPYLTLRFVDVSSAFPATLPQHLIDNNVDMSLYEKGTDCAPGNRWRLNYLHMGRFWSVVLWQQQILKEYDFILRLDVDATFDEPLGDNFVRTMKEKNKVFGYLCRTWDEPGCSSQIEDTVNEFAEKRDLKFKHRDKVHPHNTYWGGFGIYATSFFLYNQDWLDLTHELDWVGGFYNHRWGEQNIFPISLSLLLDFGQLYWIQEAVIYHDHYILGSCSGVEKDVDRYALTVKYDENHRPWLKE